MPIQSVANAVSWLAMVVMVAGIAFIQTTKQRHPANRADGAACLGGHSSHCNGIFEAFVRGDSPHQGVQMMFVPGKWRREKRSETPVSCLPLYLSITDQKSSPERNFRSRFRSARRVTSVASKLHESGLGAFFVFSSRGCCRRALIGLDADGATAPAPCKRHLRGFLEYPKTGAVLAKYADRPTRKRAKVEMAVSLRDATVIAHSLRP